MDFDQDTLQKVQMARQAGHDPNAIIQRAIAYQSAKGGEATKTAQQSQKGGGFLGFLSDFLIPTTKKTYQKATSGQEIGGGDILRTLLELGSFAIPFGKGASLLTRAILPGAGVGLARGLSEEDATAGSVAGSTATGAITAPIIGKLLGGTKPATGNVVKAVQKVGQGAQRMSTIASKSTIPTASGQEAFKQVATKYLKGSGTNKFRNVESVIDTLVNQVDNKLAGVKNKIPAVDFNKAIFSVAEGLQGPEKTSFLKLAGRSLQQAFGAKDLSKLEALGGVEVNSFKRVLNKQATSLYNKISKGDPLTNDQYAILQLKDLVDDFLTKIVPSGTKVEIQGLNQEMKALIEGIPELKRLSEESVSLLGTQIPGLSKGLTRATQAGADVIGRGTTAIGNRLEGLLGPAAQQIGTRAGVGAGIEGLTGAPGEVEAAAPGGDIEALLSQLETPVGEEEPQETQADTVRQAIGYLMLQNAKSVSDLKTAYELLYPQSKVGALEQRSIKQAENSLGLVGILESELGRVQSQGLAARGGGLARLGGVAGTIASLTQSSKEAAAYNRVKEAFLSNLARATGERGVLTDKDLERIRKAVPTFYDSPDVAAENFRLIREIIGGALQQGKQTEAGT